MGKKKVTVRGDKLSVPASLEDQLEKDNVAKERLYAREKAKRRKDETEEQFLPDSLSSKILKVARKQLKEDDLERDTNEPSMSKRLRTISLGAKSTKSDDEEEEEEEEFEYDDQVIQLDPQDEADLQRFMSKKEGTQLVTLYDIIQSKIESKKNEAEMAMSQVDPNEFNMREMDPEIIEMYEQIGALLSKYRSGKIPKAFKIIPKMINWEQILYITKPEQWSAAAIYQATRLFASNLNPKMCQRFYNLVLLPRVRDDIDEYKKLNYHLYQALCKAIYKPAAFFKGIILPLCESGTCTLREAVILSSVLSKITIPMFHAAAAMLKLADMEYTGSNSVFLRALIDKKYALPYKAIDAVVSHFIRQKTEERDMPVLWHQCLLALCQRYKNDMSDLQKSAIFELCRFHNHYLITPEIRRELTAKETEDGHLVTTVEVHGRPKDSMEF